MNKSAVFAITGLVIGIVVSASVATYALTASIRAL